MRHIFLTSCQTLQQSGAKSLQNRAQINSNGLMAKPGREIEYTSSVRYTTLVVKSLSWVLSQALASSQDCAAQPSVVQMRLYLHNQAASRSQKRLENGCLFFQRTLPKLKDSMHSCALKQSTASIISPRQGALKVCLCFEGISVFQLYFDVQSVQLRPLALETCLTSLQKFRLLFDKGSGMPPAWRWSSMSHTMILWIIRHFGDRNFVTFARGITSLTRYNSDHICYTM